MRGDWIRQPKNGTSVVFVHGIRSSGETCWRHANGTYWPKLLELESGFERLGIYVYSYETGIFSGTYSLNDVVDDLKERLLKLDQVAKNNHRMIFVCHSMGGIVVRKFLVERRDDLIDRNIEIGLFLLASPSLGSTYANWLTPIAEFLGHTQADALRFTQRNIWLNDLDKEFQNLKESGRLSMYGKELVEDKFVVFKGFWRKQVVEPFSGSRYFRESYKVPESDHFSIAKPENFSAVQHRLLLEFIGSIVGVRQAARWLPAPIDFELFLSDKRKNFIGRSWLFAEINEWLAHGPEPAMLIAGEPGIGKSAVVAKLVQDNLRGQVLAYHCCRADMPSTVEPAEFVCNLAAMIAIRVDAYAKKLDEEPNNNDKNPVRKALKNAASDPATAFETGILSPLHSVPAPEGGHHYLLIDALDEALTFSGQPNIVQLLSQKLQFFPSWLRIVITTRDERAVLDKFSGLRPHVLGAKEPPNEEDVRQYLLFRLNEALLREKVLSGDRSLPDLVEAVSRVVAGNFLVVVTALEAIERGYLTFEQIEQLPSGLSNFYRIFFERLFPDPKDFEPSRQVLEVLVAAGEPLTLGQIAGATGMDAEGELLQVLRRLASFIPAHGGYYALYHKALFDWLTEWDKESNQPLAGIYYASLKKGHASLANWCWGEYQKGVKFVSLYCLRHLPLHLVENRRHEEMRKILQDFEWLEAKARRVDVESIVADLAAAHKLMGEGRWPQLLAEMGASLPDIKEALGSFYRSPECPSEDRCQYFLTQLFLNQAKLLRHGATETAAKQHLTRLGQSYLELQWRTAIAEGTDRSPGMFLMAAPSHSPNSLNDLLLTGFTGGNAFVPEAPSGLIIRDLQNGAIKHTRDFMAPVLGAATLPNGNVLALTTGELELWNPETGEERKIQSCGYPKRLCDCTYRGDSGCLFKVSPNGRFALGSRAISLEVLNLDTGQRRSIPTPWGVAPHQYPSPLAVLPDSRHVVWGAYLCDFLAGESQRLFNKTRGGSLSVAVDNTGTYAALGSWFGELSVVHLRTRDEILVRGEMGSIGCIEAIALMPEKDLLIAGGDRSGNTALTLWDFRRKELIATANPLYEAAIVEVVPESRRILVVDRGGTIHCFTYVDQRR